jgi:hypothetical protein
MGEPELVEGESNGGGDGPPSLAARATEDEESNPHRTADDRWCRRWESNPHSLSARGVLYSPRVMDIPVDTCL